MKSQKNDLKITRKIMQNEAYFTTSHECIGWRKRHEMWLRGEIPVPPCPTFVMKKSFHDMDDVIKYVDGMAAKRNGKFSTNMNIKFMKSGKSIHYWFKDGKEGFWELTI